MILDSHNTTKSIFFGEVITVKGKYEQYVRFCIKHQPTLVTLSVSIV